MKVCFFVELILIAECGYLAETKEDYAQAFEQIFTDHFNSPEKLEVMRRHAREKVKRFSDEIFMKEFFNCIKTILYSI